VLIGSIERAGLVLFGIFMPRACTQLEESDFVTGWWSLHNYWYLLRRNDYL